jgi:hypothetical protein
VKDGGIFLAVSFDGEGKTRRLTEEIRSEEIMGKRGGTNYACVVGPHRETRAGL